MFTLPTTARDEIANVSSTACSGFATQDVPSAAVFCLSGPTPVTLAVDNKTVSLRLVSPLWFGRTAQRLCVPAICRSQVPFRCVGREQVTRRSRNATRQQPRDRNGIG